MGGLRAGDVVCGQLHGGAAVWRLAGVPAQGIEPVKRVRGYLILLLLLAACFSLATILQQRASGWSKRAQSDNILNVLFGTGAGCLPTISSCKPMYHFTAVIILDL